LENERRNYVKNHIYSNNSKKTEEPAMNYDTNIPDDVKVSRYPFGAIDLERPKSEVLKKILGAKEDADIKNDKESNKITITSFVYPEPVSLTLYSDENESELTESRQPSPVIISNNQGISSINITSFDYDLNQIKNNLNTFASTVTDTPTSQPSSIIMIEDEKLDFSLQTVDDGSFSIEMNGTQTPPPPPPKVTSFVTAITVKSNDAPEAEKLTNGSVENGIDGEKHTTVTTITPEVVTEEKPVEKSAEIPFIPRNTEIKFTTSTYESPLQKSYNEKRISQIEQIRSAFERNNGSDIPVPVPARRSSIPNNSKSPSRIPVFNSSKITNNNNESQKNSPPSKRNSLTNNNNVISSKLSASLTSIKNQSRHPSGK
jgi:hypothetical protein